MHVEIDLYRDDLAAFTDPEIFAAIEAFTRVLQPATDRTQEAYLLDFKATGATRSCARLQLPPIRSAAFCSLE
jgi:hypothetical protein